MKIRKKEKKDWDFDFSIYEHEDKKDTPKLLSLKEDNKPMNSIFAARFTPTGLEIENIIALKNQISEKAIKVRANTQNVQDLWDLFAIVSELWARIHDIFGRRMIQDIDLWENFIRKKLFALNKKSYITFDNHSALMKYTKTVYKLCQRINLGIQIEKRFSARYGRIRNQIVE
jgi:hypothetical protein